LGDRERGPKRAASERELKARGKKKPTLLKERKKRFVAGDFMRPTVFHLKGGKEGRETKNRTGIKKRSRKEGSGFQGDVTKSYKEKQKNLGGF